MKKVFLGGSAGREWRKELIPLLKIDYFDPVGEVWTKEAQAEISRQRETCDFYLFVLTPKMADVYSIAELVHATITRQSCPTLFCVLDDENSRKFGLTQMVAFADAGSLPDIYALKFLYSLKDVAAQLNISVAEIPFNPNRIECLIKRDGQTQITLGKMTYAFKQDASGNSVCEVLSQAHRKHFLSLADFRVYKEAEAPKTEFTQKEEAFLSTWNFLGKDDFLAFVNGHIPELIDAPEKIRAIATAKWHKLLPDMESCPFASIEETEVPAPVLAGSSETKNVSREPTAFETKFYEQWRLYPFERFQKIVEDKEQQFLDLPVSLWDKAKNKWDRIVTPRTGDPWPFEEVSGERSFQ